VVTLRDLRKGDALSSKEKAADLKENDVVLFDVL
jgi:hypothetical protein